MMAAARSTGNAAVLGLACRISISMPFGVECVRLGPNAQ